MKKSHKLGELSATAICGNDISSSVLYVSALSISFAGQYAWITLLIVAVILFLYRKIYGEVVGALPLNGGAYNALLNTTSKSVASLAASLTLLSYMATAVISANEAMHYLHHLIPPLPVVGATVGLLAVFASLAIVGIRESSKVAVSIFIFHMASLLLLAGFIIKHLVINGMSQFILNWNFPLKGSITMAIFFGFAASMLGISGFESSANFVEEQKKGVFPKTLRNMWIVVSIINPLMAFLALACIPILEIRTQYSTTLLSRMGQISSGTWLAILISIDAFLVLSGAVLTSFVGVSGLLERMTLDRILPQFFLKKSKRGSAYRIIIAFFMLCVSVLLITKGNVGLLAGVYTISFLSVMILFGAGNILLKVKRAHLPRPERSPWLGVLTAILATAFALVGNILIQPEKAGEPRNVTVFMEYFIPVSISIWIMLNRILLLRMLLQIARSVLGTIQNKFNRVIKRLNTTIDDINSQKFVYFAKRDNLAVLNKVMLYIKNNEQTKNVKMVHISAAHDAKEEAFLQDFSRVIKFLDEEYPEIGVECVKLDGNFGPQLIRQLSKEWKIPINFMFIASPGDKFPYKIEELGGVRLII